MIFDSARSMGTPMGALDVDPTKAYRSRWARRWKLSPRVARVAAYLFRGHTDREIAEVTGLSVLTVRTYISSLLRAAGAHNRIQLVRCALEVAKAAPHEARQQGSDNGASPAQRPRPGRARARKDSS